MNNYRIVYTDGSDERFVRLCRELDGFLYGLIGQEVQSSEYDQYNGLEDIHDVLLVLDQDTPVGCGSFKEYEDGVAEVKRVFVKEQCRRNGLANMIMDEIEKRAKKAGFHRLILETGEIMESARRFYEKCGFSYISNYGQYERIVTSVCMEKCI